MDIENIKSLAKLMEVMGFSNLLDKELIYHACLRQKEFHIKQQKVYGSDVMSFVIYFETSGRNNKLICSHYDASLRKLSIVNESNINGIDVPGLEERMKNVNWAQLSQFSAALELDMDNKETWKEQLAVESIMCDLEVLSSGNEGKEVADALRYKYWTDLPLENLIPNLHLLKSKLEYSQRFYMIGKESITAGEAYRFLNNRWIQRRMQTEKKKESNYGANDKPAHITAKQPVYKKRKTKNK